MPNRRLLALLALLAAAAGLVLFSDPPRGSGEVVAPSARAAAPRPGPADPGAGGGANGGATGAAGGEGSGASGMILALRPRGAGAKPGDAFAPNNWNPPPPPPPPPPPQNLKPTAPPLPFTLLGKKLEDGAWQVFLAQQDRTLVVRAQDVIDGTYRVESIEPPNLVLTYIPLKQRQVIAIGGID